MTNSEKIAQLDILDHAWMCSKLCDVHIVCQNCELLQLCYGTMRGSSVEQWAEWLESEAEPDER